MAPEGVGEGFLYHLSSNASALELGLLELCPPKKKPGTVIPIAQLSIKGLCRNTSPRAMHFLSKYAQRLPTEKVDLFCALDWEALMSNSTSISFFVPFLDKLKEGMPRTAAFLRALSSNRSDYAMLWLQLEGNQDFIDWQRLSLNPGNAAVQFLLEVSNREKIDWTAFSENPHPLAVAWMRENLEKVNWQRASKNTGAVSLLRDHLDKIDWVELCSNASEEAIQLLRTHASWAFPQLLEEENVVELSVLRAWKYLSGNPTSEAMDLLESRPWYIHFTDLCSNPHPRAVMLLAKFKENVIVEDLARNPNMLALLNILCRDVRIFEKKAC